MGPAHSMVVNKTHKKVCVLTFNHADLTYFAYQNIYVLEPGETKQVEALSNPLGLKIAVVYDAAPDGQILMYQRWVVKNESVLTITSINGSDIATYGDNTVTQGKGTIRESNEEKFAMAIDALTYLSPVTRSAISLRDK